MRRRPTSSNGASSMHLWWQPAQPVDDAIAVSVTLTVVVPPTWRDLCFWALQASFVDGNGSRGAAHLGLQWHAPHPGSTAVNFGGYRDGAGELAGTASALPSATGNPNTRDFDWRRGIGYRLEIESAGDGRWTGYVGGEEIRTLECPGDRLAGFVMWTECFAPCHATPAIVRWSDPCIVRRDGTAVAAPTCRAGYQSWAAGGCATGTSTPVAGGIEQRTGVARTTPDGAVLATA